MRKMALFCAFIVLIWVAELQLTSSNITDKANQEDDIADFMGDARDLRDPCQQSDTALFERLQNFIKEKNLKQECNEEAKKKKEHLQKERKERDKIMLRKDYQILQHGKGSFASIKEWLSAMKSGICTGCVVKKICSQPPTFLPKYVPPSF